MYRFGILITLGLFTAPAALSAQSAHPVTASWNATWDLVGSGFDDGSRTAVLSTERRGDDCICLVQGPPGALVSSVFSNDSLFLVWDLGDEELMLVDLQLEGDRLAGSWRIGAHAGEVIGARRP